MLYKKLLLSSTIGYCLLSPLAVWAAPKLAPARLEGQPIEDLPAPYNLQAVTLNRSVSLSWSWDPPDPGPAFKTFGYEVQRDASVIAIVPKTAFTDLNVPVGEHLYQVRAKGGAKEVVGKVAHYSGWSEPAGTQIKQTCSGPPVIELNVQPTKKVYGSIPALRLHFTGDIRVPEGCRAEKATFHIDSGLSSERSGPLSPDAKGHFDEFIDAMGPAEEYITGGARFAISVTARTEAGGATSSVFTIDLQQQNRYAPRDSPK